MIELIAAAVSGAVVGGLTFVGMWRAERILDRKLIASQRDLINAHWSTHDRLCDTLTALRSNCFITNEKGHRVRYSQASVERRVKAETPKELV